MRKTLIEVLKKIVVKRSELEREESETKEREEEKRKAEESRKELEREIEEYRQGGTLSLYGLRKTLNKYMRCPAGQNQLYVLSRMKSTGRLKKEAPMLALDCKIRSFLGWRKKVYYDFIRKVCCGDYKDQCEAWETFMARRKKSFLAP